MNRDEFEELKKRSKDLLLQREMIADQDFLNSYQIVKNRTMLGVEVLYDLYNSVRFLDKNNIEGSIIEIGTWNCGALALCGLITNLDRELIGFDTFEGHPEPESYEIDIRGANMLDRWKVFNNNNEEWCGADYLESQSWLRKLFPKTPRFQLIKGNFNETFSSVDVSDLALLRIDIDWYKESKLALETFWPLLKTGGILILDDYGHHPGQRQAADEFLKDKFIKLNHINYTCVSGIKLG